MLNRNFLEPHFKRQMYKCNEPWKSCKPLNPFQHTKMFSPFLPASIGEPWESCRPLNPILHTGMFSRFFAGVYRSVRLTVEMFMY